MTTEELKILKKIKPSKTEKEKVEKFVEILTNLTEDISKPFYAHPKVCGSIAKDTWLSGNHDIDLFIVFRKKIPRDKLEETGLLIGTEICEKLRGTYDIRYAEHPYIRVKANGFEIDVVPCYETKKGEGIISAVDRSPHHTNYVVKKLKGSLVDQARLLKYFCKKIEIYGADAKHNGFSGYLCELLVINYGTFAETLKTVSKLNFGEIIDPENISKQGEAKKRFNDPLIVIDPVDKNRNVASPLSAQNFFRFKQEAEGYLKSKKFPENKNIYKNMLIEKLKEDRGTNFIGITFNPPDINLENLYPQITRLEKRLYHYLREQDFSPVRHFSWTDEIEVVHIIFELEENSLPKFKRQEGPSIFSKEVKNFLSKYLENNYKPYIEDNKFYAGTKRKVQSVDTALKNFIKRNRGEIPEKIRSKKIRILDEEEIIKEVNQNKELNSLIYKRYFEV